ncbi:MAG TPA: hypothetical protein VJ249_01460 [Candidatus Bathyarchaeia archaeon]|nr:hypothetical protein [Candidatus Bathyarchaeia archaeon]
MTEEPNPPDEQPKTTDQPVAEPIPKQLIDRPSDFRFHAAYTVYSDAWDKTSSSDTKLKLNEAITALSEDKIDYETFYRQTSHYRVQHGPEQFEGGRGRMFIETQRKRDWRKREERTSRNKRHGR